MSCKTTGGRVSGQIEERQEGHIWSQSPNEEGIKSQINNSFNRIVSAGRNQTGSFASGRCDALCTMTLASLSYELWVLCVVLTTVTAGKKLPFVFRIVLFSIKVKSAVKCIHSAASLHKCGQFLRFIYSVTITNNVLTAQQYF